MRLSRSKLHIKFLTLGFSVDILKITSKTKFSYIRLKKFKAKFNNESSVLVSDNKGVPVLPKKSADGLKVCFSRNLY